MPVPGLRWAVVDDCAFFVDLAAGRYFALDAERSAVWRRLCAMDFDPAGDRQAAELVHEAQSLGWLHEQGIPVSSVPVAVFALRTPDHVTPALALFSLLRWAVALRFGNFGKVYRRITLIDAGYARTNAAPDALEAVLAAFRRAEAWLPARFDFDDCLPRSLALFVLLRRAGIPARHHIGIRRYPFAAHAWVEALGAPLLHGAHQDLTAFVPLATLGR